VHFSFGPILSEPGWISAGFQWTGSTPAGFQEAFRADLSLLQASLYLLKYISFTSLCIGLLFSHGLAQVFCIGLFLYVSFIGLFVSFELHLFYKSLYWPLI